MARKTIQNTRRRDNRHDAVAVRLTEVRHSLADAGEHPDLVAHRADIAATWPLLSEWTYVLLAGPDSEATGLMPEGLADQEDPAADAREGFMGSYTSDPGEAPTLARSGIIGYGAAGSVPTDGLWDFGDDEECSPTELSRALAGCSQMEARLSRAGP